jgi:hypothetical protein
MNARAHYFATRHAAALVAAIALLGCSHDSTDPTLGKTPAASSSAPGTGTSPQDTVGSSPGEWHLQTIRGQVLGMDRAATGDTSATNTTPIANATVEIHKISLVIMPPAGADSAKQSPASPRRSSPIGSPSTHRRVHPSPVNRECKCCSPNNCRATACHTTTCFIQRTSTGLNS